MRIYNHTTFLNICSHSYLFQLENEYSSVGYYPEGPDQKYLYQLKDLMDSNGIKELLYTSDNGPVEQGSIPEGETRLLRIVILALVSCREY